MKKPSVESIIGNGRVKPWTVEPYSDTYGVFLVEELNEACVNMALIQDPECVPWINSLDLLTKNIVSNIPLMLALLLEVKNLQDIPQLTRVRIIKLIERINDFPDIPPSTDKYRPLIKSKAKPLKDYDDEK